LRSTDTSADRFEHCFFGASPDGMVTALLLTGPHASNFVGLGLIVTVVVMESESELRVPHFADPHSQ